MSAKVHEAQEHCKAAEKYLKTSLLRWKPEYDSAADEYNQAAQCYRIARDMKNSMECYIKASGIYSRINAYFHAAKALENALLVSKETAQPEELYKLAYDGSTLYQQHGSGDSGASILVKGAKILERSRPDLAVKLYRRAADVSSSESSQHQGAEYMSKASRLYVALGEYDEAVDSLRREIAYHQEADNTGAVGRLVLAAVLVQLVRGDAIAAEKAYKEWGASCEVAEMQTIEQLLQAYDEGDRELAARALRSPFLRSMDVEYSRLASIVPLPEAMEVVAKPAARPGAGAEDMDGSEAAGYTAQPAASADWMPEKPETGKHDRVPDEEEEEDELC